VVASVDDRASLTDDADRNEPMFQGSWLKRPCPVTVGPRYETEITAAHQLREVRAGLRSWLPSAAADGGMSTTVLDGLLLAMDELAANGLRHGGVPVRVRAVLTAQCLLLEVSDADPHNGPKPAAGRDPALGGMGLHVVAHLSFARGWEVRGDRKHVWACLPVD
jgi:anti-sigma regulatory factor (Ser/Thr protein kinase)